MVPCAAWIVRPGQIEVGGLTGEDFANRKIPENSS
jgi:hypothetical protein